MEKPNKSTKSTPPAASDSNVQADPTDFSEMSVPELQEKLVKLGMPKEDVAKFKSQSVLIPVINAMSAQRAVSEDQPTIATVDPKEDRKIEKNWTSKAHRQWGYWNEQPKVKILVPLNGKEKQGVIRWQTDPRMKVQVPVHVSGAVQSVIENGARYLVPKGIYVEVPEPVAKIIEQKFQQTSDAGRDILADRTDPETGKPVAEQLS